MVTMTMNPCGRLAIASLLLMLLLITGADAAGFSRKNKTRTSRAHARKTQNGVLPDTKLTAIQVRGARKKDTPAQPPSTRVVGDLQVTTTEGSVKGFIPQYEVQPTNDYYGVRAWLGLSYAAPPVGQLRFAPPHPPPPYGVTYKAYAEKPPCPQFQSGSVVGTEDCLHLDVYSPRSKPDPAVYPHGYPVVVNIHGGAYQFLSSKFDGAPFAKKNTVVVNVSFRLGVFGALVSPDGTTFKGNQHLLDQIQALQWVRSNIRAFDGNPQQVTLMGQSTGASDVLCLMASPLARGLFQAAYPQSAFAIQTYDNMSDARAVGTEFYKDIGCSTGGPGFNATDCMLTQPTIGFLGVQLGTFYTGIYKGPGANTDDHRVFGPVVQPDTNILPKQPYAAFAAGEISDVPLFYWLVAAEGNRETFTKYDAMNETMYRETIAQRWGPQYVDTLVGLYPFPDDKVYPSSTDYRYPLSEMFGSYWRVCPGRKYMRLAQSSPNLRVLPYHTYAAVLSFVPTFNWATAPAGSGCQQMTCHADDLPLMWLDSAAMIYEADSVVARAFNSALNNFIQTACPNEGAWSAQLSVKYPLYSQDTQRQFASLDYLRSGILKDYQNARCAFWDSLSTWGV